MRPKATDRLAGVRRGTSLRPVAAAFVCFGVFWGTWAVSVLDIKATLGVSNGAFGLVLSVALLAAAAANVVAGPLSERWGTGRTLAGALAGWGLLIILASTLHAAVIFGSVLVGVIALGGAIDVVMNVAATAALGQRPGHLVRFHALFNAGAVAGALATGLVSRFADVSWRWIWLAVGLTALALAQWCGRVLLPAGTVGERHGPLAALRTIRREHLIVLAIAFATAAMVEGGIDTWGVLFLRQQLASGLLVGALAYVVKPFTPNDLLPAIEIALARYAQIVALESEVADMVERFETRKLVDRAKGLLNEKMGLSEPEAFRWIQKASMDRRLTMHDVAQAVIEQLSAPKK